MDYYFEQKKETTNPLNSLEDQWFFNYAFAITATAFACSTVTCSGIKPR